MKKYRASPKIIFLNSLSGFGECIWAEDLKDLCSKFDFYLDEDLDFEALEKELEKNGEVVIGEYIVRVVGEELG